MENTATVSILLLIAALFVCLVVATIAAYNKRSKNSPAQVSQPEAVEEEPIPELHSDTVLPEGSIFLNSTRWMDFYFLSNSTTLMVSTFDPHTWTLAALIKTAIDNAGGLKPKDGSGFSFVDKATASTDLESIWGILTHCLSKDLDETVRFMQDESYDTSNRRISFTEGGIVQSEARDESWKSVKTKMKIVIYSKFGNLLAGRTIGLYTSDPDVSYRGVLTVANRASYLAKLPELLGDGSVYLYEAEIELEASVLDDIGWEQCNFLPVPAIGTMAIRSLMQMRDSDGKVHVQTYFSEGCFVIQARSGNNVILISDSSTTKIVKATDPLFFTREENRVVEHSLLSDLLKEKEGGVETLPLYECNRLNLNNGETLSIDWFHNKLNVPNTP